MRTRPSNYNKNLTRTKSPVILTSHPPLPPQSKHPDKHSNGTKHDIHRMGSADIKLRFTSPEAPREIKKKGVKIEGIREVKVDRKEAEKKVVKMEGMAKMVKDQDDNTTEQSSSQHLSYVTGQYQLDSYDLFSRRKNVKFQQKAEDLQKTDKIRGSSHTSRNSSILKNSSRILDRSLLSSQKSISIQNSFTATKRCKIGLTVNSDDGNACVRKKYQSVIESLRNSKEKGYGRQKYIDELFPPVEASIFSTSVHRKGHISRTKDDIVWMRLSQIFTQNTIVFSKDKPGVDVKIWRGQRAYAQNYLVSSFNAIKTRSMILEHIFEKQEVNPFGIYLVKIYQQNSWKYVIVDDLVPCIYKRGKGRSDEMYTPLFLNVSVPEGQTVPLWPFLLEKAYANYYSSYENLCFGNPIDFLAQITGAPYKQIPLASKKISKEQMSENVSKIGGYFTNDGVVGLGWSEEKDTFFPISVLKQIYTGERIQLGLGDPTNSYNSIKIQLRDLPQLISTVFIFFFKEYSSSITCPVYPPKMIKQRPRKGQKQQKKRFMQIPPNDSTSLRAFTLFKKTKCCINIRQKQNRFYWQCGITEYTWVRCLLLQIQYDGGYRWVNGKYSNNKNIIFQDTLDAGEYILVIMVEWRDRHNKELTAFLYSDCDFLKLQRKHYVREQKVIETACMDYAQSNGKLNQINKSICAYTYLCQETGLVIENIVNERTKGEVTIMRSINGLKSKVEILPINKQFQVDGPLEYGSVEKGEGRKVIGQSVEVDIQKGESFTVVLRMRGGMDRKFFRIFNFG